MFANNPINATVFYTPEQRIGNNYFAMLNGMFDEWVAQHTGIRTRSKTQDTEIADSMGIRAVRDALPSLPYNIRDVDLIVLAFYTPDDTICTTAYCVQYEFDIKDAAAFNISSAICGAMPSLFSSSPANAFSTGRSKYATSIRVGSDFCPRRRMP